MADPSPFEPPRPVPALNRKLRIVLFSTLYPSSARPNHGVFVETRLRKLVDAGEVEAVAVAPVPWFHSTNARHGERARMALTARTEARHGITVLHPRYLLPPRIGQNIAPLMLALGAWGTLRRLRREGFEFDLIDAHYFYPDGVAAAMLSRWTGKPLVITARGSDLNVLGQMALPRAMMRWAARRAAACVGVCRALTNILQGWGVDQARLHVIRNGVDLHRFTPLRQELARERLGIGGKPVLIAVGHLVEVKGVDLVIAALARLKASLPDASLYVVGEGPLRASLQAQASAAGLTDSVNFVGAVPNENLTAWYSAADVLVLASRSEGWANVLLESMACATPVVATNVGGSAEVVSDPTAGAVVDERNADAIAAAVSDLLGRQVDRQAVRAYAERFSWDDTTKAQVGLFKKVVKIGPSALRHLHA